MFNIFRRKKIEEEIKTKENMASINLTVSELGSPVTVDIILNDYDYDSIDCLSQIITVADNKDFVSQLMEIICNNLTSQGQNDSLIYLIEVLREQRKNKVSEESPIIKPSRMNL